MRTGIVALALLALAASSGRARASEALTTCDTLSDPLVCVKGSLVDGASAFLVDVLYGDEPVEALGFVVGEEPVERCSRARGCDVCVSVAAELADVSKLCPNVTVSCPLAEPHVSELGCVLFDASEARGREALPVLPDQFSAVVEANILEKRQTLELREYFDREAGVVRQELHHDEERVLHITDTEAGQFASVGADGSCTVTALNGTGPGSAVNPADGRLRSAAELFEGFASGGAYTYEGESVARNIPCDHWREEVNHTFGPNFGIAYTLVWHFAQPDWEWRFQAGHRLPVRAVLNGSEYEVDAGGGWTPTKPFNHVYDWVSFVPGRPDPDLMRLPDGADCALLEQQGVPEPSANFRAAIERTSSGRRRTHLTVEWYDFDGNRVRLERGIDSRGLEEVEVLDGDAGRAYKIFFAADGTVSECEDVSIETAGRGGFRWIYDPTTHHLRRLAPGHVRSPLTGDVPNFRYVGERTARGGLPVGAWVANFEGVEYETEHFGTITLTFRQTLHYKTTDEWALQGNRGLVPVASIVSGSWTPAGGGNATEFHDEVHYLDVDVREPPEGAFNVPAECPGGPEEADSGTFTAGGVAALSVFTLFLGAAIGAVVFHRRGGPGKRHYRLDDETDSSSASTAAH